MPINWNSFTEFGIAHIPCGALSEKESTANHGLTMPANVNTINAGSATVSFQPEDVFKPVQETEKWGFSLVCKVNYPTPGTSFDIFGAAGSSLHISVENVGGSIRWEMVLTIGGIQQIIPGSYNGTGSKYVHIRAYLLRPFYQEFDDSTSFKDIRFEVTELDSSSSMDGVLTDEVVYLGEPAYTGNSELKGCSPLYMEFSQRFFADSTHGNINPRQYFQAWMFCAGSGSTVETCTNYPAQRSMTGATWSNTTDYEARGFFRHCVEDSVTAGLLWPPDVLNPGRLPPQPSGANYSAQSTDEVVTLFGVGLETPQSSTRTLAFPSRLDRFYTVGLDLISATFDISFNAGGLWTIDDASAELSGLNSQFVLGDSLTDYYRDTVEFDETASQNSLFSPHNLFNTNGGRLYGVDGAGRSLGINLKPINIPSAGRDETIRRFDTIIVGPVTLDNINQTAGDAVLKVTFDTVNAGELFQPGDSITFPLTFLNNDLQDKGYFICKMPKQVDVSAFTLSFLGDITSHLYVSQVMIGNRISIRCPDIGAYVFYQDDSEWNRLADGTQRVNSIEPVKKVFTSWTYISKELPNEILQLQSQIGRRRLLFADIFTQGNPTSIDSYFKGLFFMEEWTEVSNMSVDLWQAGITFSESITKENDVV